MWAANFAPHHPNVVVLDLSSFKCGHDAPTYGLIDSIIETSKTPYAALHDIDANKPSGSIKIRVKTYAHALKLHEERLSDASKRKGELMMRIEQKRLELLELRKEQLEKIAKKDPSVEAQINETRAKIEAYEAKLAPRPVEMPAGMIRLGKKNSAGNIERIAARVVSPAANEQTASEGAAE